MVREEASSLTGDCMFAVDKLGNGGKVGGDIVEGITNVITEAFFAVMTLEEVVSKWIKGAWAVGAWLVR